MTKDPVYMDLLNCNKAPDPEFLFGTDTLGRDIFSMIWYGGRISLLIGILSTVISVFTAILIGAFSGVSPRWLDDLIMRFTEIFLSIPSWLLVVLLQAIMGKAKKSGRFETVSMLLHPDGWAAASFTFSGSILHPILYRPLCLWLL